MWERHPIRAEAKETAEILRKVPGALWGELAADEAEGSEKERKKARRMTKEERARLLDLVEGFCDADRRGRVSPEMAERYGLTLEEAMRLLEEGTV